MSESVGDLYYQVVLETKQLLAEAQKVEARLQRMADKGGQAGDQLQAKMTTVAAAVSAALSAIAVETLVTKIISAQRQFDVMFASLKTMTGGLEQASEAYEKLTKFAAQTPFTLKQSVDGFVKLKALGLDPSERAMTSFGNTASAMGKDLMQMIEAVADASTGEFERLKEFGIKAKVEGDKVSLTFRGVTTQVQNNASAITDYLVKIGETDFAGAMSERMNTLDGNISNLQDSLDGLFLSIAQSGFGEAVAAGVRKASEAIGELTTSIKQGELTDYFAKLKPFITAAEVAVISLAGAFASRLIVSFVSAAAQAYATATAIGAATVAANGFTAALTLLGGPIGIAITGLALLALNWDKVAGEARDAATMSEEAADRIAKALGKGGAAAGKALAGQLGETRAEIAAINKELANTKFPMADPKQLDELRQRKATLEKIATDITAAMDGTRAKPDAPTAPPPPSAGGAKGAKKTPFDSAHYLAGLSASAATEWDKVGVIEKEALRKNAELLTKGDINRQQSEQAVTLIAENARQDRQKIMDKEFDDAVKAGEKRFEAEKAAADKIAAQKRTATEILVAGDPAAQLQLELETKSAMLNEFAAFDQANAQLYADAKVALEQQTADRIKAISDKKVSDEATKNAALYANYSNMFGGMAGVVKAFAGDQNGVYKALFATQKAFAIASSIVSISQGAAKAMELGFPQGLAAAATVAAQGASLISTITGTSYGGGRENGGPVSADQFVRFGEKGKPEMFTSGGKNYLLPGDNGKVTSNTALQGGGIHLAVEINNAPEGTTAVLNDAQTKLIVNVAAQKGADMAIARMEESIASNSGSTWRTFTSSSNLRGAGF